MEEVTARSTEVNIAIPTILCLEVSIIFIACQLNKLTQNKLVYLCCGVIDLSPNSALLIKPFAFSKSCPNFPFSLHKLHVAFTSPADLSTKDPTPYPAEGQALEGV